MLHWKVDTTAVFETSFMRINTLIEFSKYHMKIMLHDLNVKARKELVFRLIIKKDNLHEICLIPLSTVLLEKVIVT